MTSPLRCQRCPEPAAIVVIEKAKGKSREIHLCLECARALGYDEAEAPAAAPLPPIDWGKLEAQVDAIVSAQFGENRAEPADSPCPICGGNYEQFRERGRLGCPHDYLAFERNLVPLIARTHGATRHVGKLPARGGGGPGRLQLLARLRSAVAREDYETAARLRDELRSMSKDASP